MKKHTKGGETTLVTGNESICSCVPLIAPSSVTTKKETLKKRRRGAEENLKKEVQ
jgi:hypothetical protein